MYFKKDFQDFMCPICVGFKVLHIGAEITDEKLPTVRCDSCEGKGFLRVYFDANSNQNTWRRLTGEQ